LAQAPLEYPSDNRTPANDLVLVRDAIRHPDANVEMAQDIQPDDCTTQPEWKNAFRAVTAPRHPPAD
jgi:hypothetical protein